VKIIDSGAFVKLTPGTDGMLRISEIDYKHVDKVTDYMKVGDKVKVKVIRTEMGKVEVSMKALIPPPPGYVERRRSYDNRGGGGRSGYRPRRSSGPRERRY
jgi:polyribonucleotide nucleotidyltransferase